MNMSTDTIWKPIKLFASIRTLLWLGFGLILGLTVVATLIGLFGFRRLGNDAQQAFERATRMRELSLELDKQFLLARQSEAGFLTSWRSDGFDNAFDTYVIENQNHLAHARQSLVEFEALVVESSDQKMQHMIDEVSELRLLFDSYEATFLATVDKVEERSQSAGLEQTLANQLNTIEDDVVQFPQNTLFELVLRIRNNERAYFVNNHPEYSDNIRLLANQFVKTLEESSNASLSVGNETLSRQDLTNQLNAYLASFNQLVALEREIDVNATIFDDVTESINNLTQHLSEEGEKALTQANTQLQLANSRSSTAMISGLLVALLASVGIAVFLSRRIVTPLTLLSEAAYRFADGAFDHKAIVPNNDEFATLAHAYNAMTDQLLQSIRDLEIRSQSLETIAVLSENLTAILDLDTLMFEVVRQVQNSFGYYHAHIYLLDSQGENLEVGAGTGVAGEEMQARGHSIPLHAATSLVARAARTAEIVSVENVRESEDWLANPLLPDTHSEMAVPIILNGKVVGVLDVQEDTVAGLNESDANLLRSLANQIAVAIRNAQLFNQVEVSLTEAQRLHEKYMNRAWDKRQIDPAARHHHFTRSDAPAISDTVVSAFHRAATERDNPSIISFDEKLNPAEESTGERAIIAPISLRDRTIGTIQIHSPEEDVRWTDDDLAIVEAVTEQLAQMADNLRLFEETQERASREQLVGNISRKLRQAPDLESLMKVGISEISAVLGVDRAFVHFGNEEQLIDQFKPERHLNGSSAREADHLVTEDDEVGVPDKQAKGDEF